MTSYANQPAQQQYYAQPNQPQPQPSPYNQQAYYSGGPSSYPPQGLEAGEPKYYNLPPANPPKIVTKPKFEDVWATILFLLANAAFIGAAYIGVPETIKAFNNSTSATQPLLRLRKSVAPLPNNSSSDLRLLERTLGVIAGPLIHITYWLSLLVLVGLTGYYFYIRLWIAGAIWAVFCVLFAINYFFVRNLMLQTCTRIVSQFNGTIVAGFLGLIFSAIYSVAWIATIVVTRNTIHVTVSGTFATVYFTGVAAPGSKRIEVPEKAVTLKASGRALTTSFGPICFGSLLVALVATLRAIADQARNESAQNGNIFCCLVATCISCLLGCIQDLLEYFNKYAFTQVAIYGKGYCQAAKDTWRLVQTRGLEAIINDSLIGNVLFIGSLLAGLTCAFVGYVYVRVSSGIADTTLNYIVVCLVSGLIGMWLFLILAEVINSGVATTYVCLAEDPATLARQQPELFAKLCATWPEIQWGMQSTVYQQY
ncbi:plasma-membrane choline transporter-domain-containing protein [Chytridium lagenaria]|nr:plasma-membrane choline transporter-domain-containing protein [Chytridium lagenaria]